MFTYLLKRPHTNSKRFVSESFDEVSTNMEFNSIKTTWNQGTVNLYVGKSFNTAVVPSFGRRIFPIG